MVPKCQSGSIRGKGNSSSFWLYQKACGMHVESNCHNSQKLQVLSHLCPDSFASLCVLL